MCESTKGDAVVDDQTTCNTRMNTTQRDNTKGTQENQQMTATTRQLRQQRRAYRSESRQQCAEHVALFLQHSAHTIAKHSTTENKAKSATSDDTAPTNERQKQHKWSHTCVRRGQRVSARARHSRRTAETSRHPARHRDEQQNSTRADLFDVSVESLDNDGEQQRVCAGLVH